MTKHPSDPRARQIAWGQLHNEAVPDDWQRWPEEQRAWVERAFARALEKFPGFRIVSDVSGCTASRRNPGKFQLWREMWVAP